MTIVTSSVAKACFAGTNCTGLALGFDSKVEWNLPGKGIARRDYA